MSAMRVTCNDRTRSQANRLCTIHSLALRAGMAFRFAFCCSPASFAPTNRSARSPESFRRLKKPKSYRGELVFVDHVNRRGSLRLHVDGHFHEGRLHHFAMLPYGMIRYRGAPAELRDIPIGTVLYGRFYLPPDPQTSAVPNVKGNDVTAPAREPCDSAGGRAEPVPARRQSLEAEGSGHQRVGGPLGRQPGSERRR